ncbi:MAG TPA: hypothetical protein VMK82_09280, partial [Steroidobacteraceae bacterium]|nr:hypothetical protein [Steroidobacteraceae bacterium]
MNALGDLPDEQRRLMLKAGGALLVGMSLGACTAGSRLAGPQVVRDGEPPLRTPLPGPPDAAQVDSWLA